MKYEFGKIYEMKVCRIDRDSAGYDYMAIEDNEGKEQRVYNILKSQFDELPYKIAVKLTYDYGDGRYRFRQDETVVLRAHYEIGKPYAFRIAAIEQDSNGCPYYNIEDDFAVQRYYYKGEPKYHIGDGCILELSSIDDKGFLHFKETEHDIPKNSDPACPIPQDSAEHYYVKYGPESIDVEYKTTIVFPPDEKGQDNIDKQMWNIVKGITALMNANGGKMIIGVHDKTQEILGIDNDYQYR